MSTAPFDSDTPLGIEMIARQERDRYLADLMKASARAVWTRLFGTRATAAAAADSLARCYVRDSGLAHMPDAHLLAARRSNDVCDGTHEDHAA
ncbi:hypothetical protein [Roseospira visakhapatnamensis]|uniref:Uncharacterized protein n=1 Tax=Roseospira visakhapatnamensis TaxID=390880 RepID=A0A7W6RBI6_9PROT|nr:hypothetical protein [Roseospira visakhapatnamensis]MBB4265380.1 hypothetical protein [Roseospira visakhapatnamensis]